MGISERYILGFVALFNISEDILFADNTNI